MVKADQDQDTRQKILEVAETQFGAKGYSGTHLQSIAEAVGVQKTALYYYFPSKEALYVSVLERMLETFASIIGAATSRAEPSAEAVESLIDDLNDVLAEHPNFSRILIRIFVDRVEVDATAIRPIVERVIDPLLRFYATGAASGSFQKLSSRHAFLSVIGAAVFYYAAGKSSSDILGIDDVFEPDAVAWRRREFRRLIIGGILPRSD